MKGNAAIIKKQKLSDLGKSDNIFFYTSFYDRVEFMSIVKVSLNEGFVSRNIYHDG